MAFKNQSEQVRAIRDATGFSLAIAGIFLGLQIFITLTIPGITYLIIGMVCLIVAWKENLKPQLAWTVGYFVSWILLVLVFYNRITSALSAGIPVFLFLLFILPLPSVVSAIIGSTMGIFLKNYFKKSKF